MTEKEYIAALKSLWPSNLLATSEVLALADRAIRECPRSARLWYFRGRLIWMAPEESLYDGIDALLSFEKAVELNPDFADAYDRMGDYYDGLMDDPTRATKYYERADQVRRRLTGVSHAASVHPAC